MEILDPGHQYILSAIDNGTPQHLAFVKREGPGYPGNVGHHGGTQSQEAIRMLIDRALYVNWQEPHIANVKNIIRHRLELFDLEKRAAERHDLGSRFLYEVGEELDILGSRPIETLPVCKKCGHIVCHHRKPIRTSMYGRNWRARNKRTEKKDYGTYLAGRTSLLWQTGCSSRMGIR